MAIKFGAGWSADWLVRWFVDFVVVAPVDGCKQRLRSPLHHIITSVVFGGLTALFCFISYQDGFNAWLVDWSGRSFDRLVGWLAGWLVDSAYRSSLAYPSFLHTMSSSMVNCFSCSVLLPAVEIDMIF